MVWVTVSVIRVMVRNKVRVSSGLQLARCKLWAALDFRRECTNKLETQPIYRT